MNDQQRIETASDNCGYSAHDMATAKASGFREAENISADRVSELEMELAALKAQPIGVVLPERMTWDGLRATACNIRGEGWNACLGEVARLNSSPVSAGVVDERAAFEAWVKKHNLSLSEDEIDQPEDINLDKQAGVYIWANAESAWLAWQARAALSAPSHGEQVQVPRVATPEMKAAIWAELDRQGFDSDLVETQSLYFAGIAAAPSAGSQGGDV